MLDMSQTERMRDMLADGYTPTEVKGTLGVPYPTVRKYAQEDDFSPQRPKASEHPSELDPHKAPIGETLEEDRHCHHKQRHTARRVFGRLRAEHGLSGSHSTVQRYMKEIRSKGPRGESVRLGWDPGTMQADFGQADFDYALGGGRARMHCLPMSFPHSDHEVCEAFADEKDVCVCQGLKDCFEHIGGAPPVIVPDNATEAGRRWRDVIVESDLFRRLRLHYGFTARFCNPNAGKGKGSVEGKVGCTRRNLFVPVPEADDLRDYSRGLAETLDAHSEEQPHYERGLGWAAPFQADKAHLLPLPKKPFDVVRWASCTTDGYGRVTLDGCHRHLASPSLACVSLTVGVRAFTVEMDAPDGTPPRTYRRRSGKLFTSDEDPLALLEPLSMKTRALTQPSVRALFDEDVRDAFGSMATDELEGRVKVIPRLAQAYGVGITAQAFSGALRATSRMRPADVETCCARIRAQGTRAKAARELGTRLADYDGFMLGGGDRDGQAAAEGRCALREAGARRARGRLRPAVEGDDALRGRDGHRWAVRVLRGCARKGVRAQAPKPDSAPQAAGELSLAEGLRWLRMVGDRVSPRLHEGRHALACLHRRPRGPGALRGTRQWQDPYRDSLGAARLR
jgi:transposase